MNLIPMPGWLIIKTSAPVRKTPEGMELPPDTTIQTPQGEVVAVGGPILRADESFEMPQITKGTKVFFQKWGGFTIKVKGEDFMFMKYSDIVAIEQDEK